MTHDDLKRRARERVATDAWREEHPYDANLLSELVTALEAAEARIIELDEDAKLNAEFLAVMDAKSKADEEAMRLSLVTLETFHDALGAFRSRAEAEKLSAPARTKLTERLKEKE